MVLEKELQTFDAHRDALLRTNRGQFALIKDGDILGTFTTFNEAFTEGVHLLGNQSFLIKQVTEKDELISIPYLSVGIVNARP